MEEEDKTIKIKKRLSSRKKGDKKKEDTKKKDKASLPTDRSDDQKKTHKQSYNAETEEESREEFKGESKEKREPKGEPLLLESTQKTQKAKEAVQREEGDSHDGGMPYFLIPLLKRPFFPGMAVPIVIEAGPYYEVLKLVMKQEEKCLAMFLTRDEECDLRALSKKKVFRQGVLARVLRLVPTEQGGAQLIVSIEERILMRDMFKNEQGHWKVHAKRMKPSKGSMTNEVKAYSISIISTIKELLKLNPLFKEELQVFLSQSDFTEPGQLADFSVALTTASREELQEILGMYDISKRMELALVILKKELDVNRLQDTINQKIETSMSKTQRDFFLKEQLKTIKKELGLEKNERACDAEKLRKKFDAAAPPPEIEAAFQEEFDKFQMIDIHSSEYAVCRTYLEWLTAVPWGTYSKESNNLNKAQKILERDHYGLQEVKERILELMSVGKLTGRVSGTIVCLAGPPGVGKTSIGKSIAQALNRKFFRFSVGGMRDEAEIKGHRRTYVGAMPGKLIQALKRTGTMNPVIMLDEVDKMGVSFHGDPASALLEVLDPEQNQAFLDHYLDVPCDLSNVLFLTTANLTEPIPSALKDRMEVLRLSGYISEEKVQIARKYLIPRNRKEVGLSSYPIVFTSSALNMVIEGYARESGVRVLQKRILHIFRQLARKIVQESESEKSESEKGKEPSSIPTRITKQTVIEMLGHPKFTSDTYYKTTPVGVCTGLAWTSLGGATLYVEAIAVPAEKGELRLTGNAGEVMKESSQIAWVYAQTVLLKNGMHEDFFRKSSVHLHIPEGATPKDGPSAGITMATALLSQGLGVAVMPNLAMTGELTLTGKVLSIGGLKEKIIAARRSKITTLLIPADNQNDYQKLPDHLKGGIDVHFIHHFDDVWDVALAPSLRSASESTKSQGKNSDKNHQEPQ